MESSTATCGTETEWWQYGCLALANTATRAAGYQLGDDIQPLLVDIEHLEGDPSLEIKVDGKSIMRKTIEQGRYILEAPMAAVKESVKSRYKVLVDGRKVASGTVLRSPRQNQTPAAYVDTRTGTAHSRWMIAPGPWMPFSMVKMSPDNQNSGWQAGYQPSFESIGCFSHIHEWTMAGLGIMAANGPLKTKVGDQRKDDEGYRSRIDKRSEKAGIGYYSARLTDYDILAEITATTRCGFERFTFPADRGEGRIILEFKPQAEYGIIIKDANITKISDTRLEGYCHEFSPNVWSRDEEMVIIMPNAGHPDTHNVWNGYFNMPGWNYEDFFFNEFLPAVEKKYRIIGDKGHRAVMGLSMGGGGSTVYCQRHPDMFSSCYAMSAWLDNESGQVGGNNTKKDKLYYVCQAVREHSALDFIDNADDATLEALRTVKWFIDCGDDDFLVRLSFELHMKMKARNVKSELRIRNGVHNWEYWHLALRNALPFASRNFK